MIKKSDWTDQKVEVIIANLLRAGVTLAAAVVLAGGLVFLVRHGFSPAGHHVFAGEPSDLRHWKGIVRAALALRGQGIIQLGLLFLIATPVARVAFSAFAFAIERDWLYVCVSSFVLIVLLYSLLGSAI
ncbi:MAG: DUF1634 domain-containing protein [Terriglobales bacterium]